MKMMSKVLVLATITLMSASAFAAEAKVGQNNDSSNCVESAKQVAKAQAQGTTGSDAPAPAATASGAAAK